MDPEEATLYTVLYDASLMVGASVTLSFVKAIEEFLPVAQELVEKFAAAVHPSEDAAQLVRDAQEKVKECAFFGDGIEVMRLYATSVGQRKFMTTPTDLNA